MIAGAEVTVRLTTALAALAAIVTAAELVVLRRDLRPGGLAAVAPWPATRPPRFAGRWQSRLPSLAVAQAALLVFALSAPAALDLLRAVGGVALLGVAVLLSLVLTFGRDGADDMAFAVVAPLGLGLVLGRDADELVLVLLGGQLLVAVGFSGVAKLRGAAWRRGSAVTEVLGTEGFGWPPLGRRLAAMPLAVQRALSWGVVAWELSLPVLVLFGGPVLGGLALAVGVAFHLGTAVVMRLNRLFLWFVSAYPAGLWLAGHSPLAVLG